MTKIIFLDVDGVLNRTIDFVPGRGTVVMNKGLCDNLHRLVERTGAKVVVSSTWRIDYSKHADDGEFNPHTNDHHMEFCRQDIHWSFHDDWRTEDMTSARSGLMIAVPRGEEIAEWLTRHPEVDKYVILDDNEWMLPYQKPNFVKTDERFGLTNEAVERAVSILGEKKMKLSDMVKTATEAVKSATDAVGDAVKTGAEFVDKSIEDNKDTIKSVQDHAASAWKTTTGAVTDAAEVARKAINEATKKDDSEPKR